MDESPLSVSRLIGLLREVVEENFMQVRVEGEVSNFSVPASGHFYFSLKDDDAQLRVVMFRTHSRLLRFAPENGMKVVCGGRVSLYSQRGELQFIAESLEPAGIGGRQLAFEQLRARLAAEGLFAEALKRPLPSHPQTVGVVTSATGAAIHDILQILRRRGAGVRVLLAPVRVQGEGAAGEIAQAIADLNRQGEAEVLIVGRGGGSIEDLWAFNEEVVARAIRASRIPVISAVGHEIDVTIADLAADLRAPTPSAAAEMVARGRLELEAHLDQLTTRMAALMEGRLELLAERLGGMERRLRSPAQDLVAQRALLGQLESRLTHGVERLRQRAGDRLGGLVGRLEALSPLATLERGYAIVFSSSGRVVRRATEVKSGDLVQVRLSRGSLRARIEEVD